ncbi:MAG: UvrD-helicase domain-containing protein [Pirellulales bacterium]
MARHSDLNPPQLEAVTTLAGPMLVLAGAGTGKTRVVTYRIAELIRRKTNPERILAVTFTNKAAKEMQQRSAALLGKRLKAKPEISTFHSLCVRVLRRHIDRLGYPKNFPIYDRGDQESIARQVLREIRVPSDSLKPCDLLYFIGNWKSRSVRPDEAQLHAGSDKEHLAAAGYRRYQKALKQAGAVDFDDLLLCTEELLARFVDVRRAEAGRFDYLLVDEYQDTNGSQYRIVKALAAGHRNLCVVGDDDQSIYGWRGAEVAHILRFKVDWPEAKVVRLEDNYRSRAPILEFANTLIAFNKTRHGKVLRAYRDGGAKPRISQFPDEEQEAEQVVNDIKLRAEELNLTYDQFAILFRTNEQPRPFEQALRKAKVPYVLVGGMSFFDRREIRDVLAYVKLLASEDDDVPLRRIINTPARGIGGGAVKKLIAAALDRGQPMWAVLSNPAALAAVPPAAREGAAKLHQSIQHGKRRLAQGDPLAATLTALLHEINYKAEILRQYPDVQEQESRWASVEEIVNSAAGYEQRTKKPTVQGFLDDIALSGREDQNEKEKQLNRNAVALMTLHAAKGLEFPHVYLVGMEEGLLPHHRSITADLNEVNSEAIDEERRLCYVGVTRAQDRLSLSLSLTRMKWGKPRDSIPSRFLYEMTGKADHPNAAAARAGRRPVKKRA